MSVPSDHRANVFISHTSSDDVTPLLALLRDLGYVVETPANVAGWQPLHAAIAERIRNADLVLAVLDEPTPSVSFEVGVAVGAGTPVLVVSRSRRQPQDLSELPSIDPGASLDAFSAALSRAIRSRQLAHGTDEPIVHEPSMSPEAAQRFLGEAQRPMDGRAFEALVAALFEQIGAQVVRTESTEGPPLSRPDLVVWHDELAAGFGLPLPIELLVRTREPRAILGRLRRTRDLAGAPNLLAISARGLEALVDVDADGRAIVIAPLQMLVGALADLPVGEAFALVRAQATLVTAAS